MSSERHRVVVIGSGFGGLFATKVLRHAPVDVTVIDRTTHHLFQPLLYQVATGILSEGEIAPPMRDVLRHQHNARVILGEVTDVDLDARTVTSEILDRRTVTPYDSLIVAAGARTSYFGNDDFAVHAPGLKTVDDALELRGRIYGAFELAEIEPDPDERCKWLTFVVVGGGPTGVEMAGQIAELARRVLPSNFRTINPADARIILLDGAPTVLGGFGEKLSRKAVAELERLGVEVHTRAIVSSVDQDGLDVDAENPDLRRIEAFTKVWAAGVQGAPLGRLIAERAGAETDRGGRVKVLPDCTVPGRPEVFVVGDLMALDGLPGVAEVAMQSGMHAAFQIKRRLQGDTAPRRFRYRNLGDLASISRYYAIGKWPGGIQVSGFLGWLLWLVVHITFLTGFKNRFTTLVHWTISFVGRGRSERTITMQQVFARRALEEAAERRRQEETAAA